MSEENVDILRRVFDADVRRESATALALYDAAVVWDVSRLGVASFGAGVFHGHAGLRAWFREWHTAWEHTRNDLEELIEAGEHVVSVHTQRGRGRSSGIQVDVRQYAVWTIRAAKITRVVWFQTREEAFEAAGLSE